LRLKAAADADLREKIGIAHKSSKALKKKKQPEIEAYKAKFFELADEDSQMVFNIISTEGLEHIEDPHKKVSDSIVSLQAHARGFLARRASGDDQVSPSISLAQPARGKNLAEIDELVANFPNQPAPTLVYAPELEVDLDELDTTYLMAKLEERASRLRSTLVSLGSVYKHQVNVYKEYQQTYQAITS